MDCVPYSEEACRDVAAKNLGWNMQTSEYPNKGCYVYEEGHKYYGTVYYGTGGSLHDKKKSLNKPRLRPKGFDCNKPGSLSIFSDSLLIRL